MAPDLNWLLLVASGYQSNSLVKQFLTRWGLDSLILGQETYIV